MSWIEFASYRQMGWWLLNTDQGLRFLSWFIRKYFKAIMATEAGSAAYEHIRSEYVEKEKDTIEHQRIVIERFPDGYLKVYAKKGDVVFIHRLSVEGDRALILEEELARLKCPRRALEVYDGRVLASDFYVGRTVEQEVARQARIALASSISGRKDSPKDRGNGKPRTGDNGDGCDRAVGPTGDAA